TSTPQPPKPTASAPPSANRAPGPGASGGRWRLELGDGVDAEDAGGGAELVDDDGGDGGVDGEDHQGGFAGWGLAEGHVGDVDAAFAEDRADVADHPGRVVVADHEHVTGGGDVGRVVVHHDDAGLAVLAGERSGDGVLAASQR